MEMFSQIVSKRKCSNFRGSTALRLSLCQMMYCNAAWVGPVFGWNYNRGHFEVTWIIPLTIEKFTVCLFGMSVDKSRLGGGVV